MRQISRTVLRRSLRDLTRSLGRDLPEAAAIPADRPGQVALLRGSGLFDGLGVENLNDAVVEVAALVIQHGAVVDVRADWVNHGDHAELALFLVVKIHSSRASLVLLPCGEGDLTDLSLRQVGGDR
jgi:hypothetical protein